MSRRRRPIAVDLDRQVENVMTLAEDLLAELDDRTDVEFEGTKLGQIADRLEADLRELRRRWLAEQTARGT